jgi:hypothetical protein
MLQHLMAAKIQQRFWYARARWNTTKRLGRKLLKSGLDIQKKSDLMHALMSEDVLRQFGTWFRRLSGQAAPSMRSVFNALGIYTFKYGCVDRAYDDSEELIRCAEPVAQALDGMLREAPAPEDFIERLDAYLAIYDKWISINEHAIRQTILRKAVSRALHLISRRPPIQNADSCLSMFIGGVGELAKLVDSSREICVVGRLKASSFWGPGDASVFKMMHEVLINGAYVLPRESVFVKFQAQHQCVPDDKIPEFLVDLRSVLMFPLRDEAMVTELAAALDIESMSFPGDLMACAERLMPLIARASPEPIVSQQIANAWRECDRASRQGVLDVLREAGRSLRYAFALVDLEQCRRSVWRHPNGFHHTQADLLISKSTYTKHTERWVWRALQGHSHLQRLADGDPFALLRFHDHSVLRYALSGDFTPPIPEVLQFDADRMGALVCDKGDVGRVIRMVESQEVPEDTPQHLKDCVASLRKLLFVCRFQHGDRIMELTRRLARQALESNMATD